MVVPTPGRRARAIRSSRGRRGSAAPCIPVGAGLAVNIISTRRRRARRADQPDSIERDQERFAAVHTLPVTLVSLAAVGAWLVVNDWFAAGALVYGTLVLTLATFWIQYARAPRHL